jgi:hypothetical protein
MQTLRLKLHQKLTNSRLSPKLEKVENRVEYGLTAGNTMYFLKETD